MKNELNVKKFWELLRKYLPLKKNIGILLFLIFSQVFCTLYMPIAVMNTIDISSGNYYEWKKNLLDCFYYFATSNIFGRSVVFDVLDGS